MIKLYTKTVCPKCMLAKHMFDQNGIDYETINIDQNEEAKQIIIDKGFMAVPIVEYDNNFYGDISQFENLIDDLK